MPHQDDTLPIEIKNVPVDLVLPLRKKFLLQHLDLDKCYYNHDLDETSLHLAAYLNGKIVGVCTVLKEYEKSITCENPWRLRGLAVEPEARGKKITHRLGLEALTHIIKNAGDLVWAYSRPTTYEMYEKIGMKPSGGEFVFEDQGLHKLFILQKEDINRIKSNVFHLLSKKTHQESNRV